MTKGEAEKAIRYLCGEWAKLRGIEVSARSAPSFEDFYGWLEQNHRLYLQFRSVVGVRSDVERWFAAEMRQPWRD